MDIESNSLCKETMQDEETQRTHTDSCVCDTALKREDERYSKAKPRCCLEKEFILGSIYREDE